MPSQLEYYDVSNNNLTAIVEPLQYNFCTKCQMFLISNNTWLCHQKLVLMLIWMEEHATIRKYNDQGDKINSVMCGGKDIFGKFVRSNKLRFANYQGRIQGDVSSPRYDRKIPIYRVTTGFL